jgi:hypothetical protein
MEVIRVSSWFMMLLRLRLHRSLNVLLKQLVPHVTVYLLVHTTIHVNIGPMNFLRSQNVELSQVCPPQRTFPLHVSFPASRHPPNLTLPSHLYIYTVFHKLFNVWNEKKSLCISTLHLEEPTKNEMFPEKARDTHIISFCNFALQIILACKGKAVPVL